MFGMLFNIAGGAYKIPMLVGVFMVAIASFWTWLAVHDHNIRNEVIKEFNQAQEQLLAEKQAEFDQHVINLGKEAETLRKEIENKNQNLQALTDDIEKSIVAIDGNNLAPKYLREVVSKLNNNFSGKSK